MKFKVQLILGFSTTLVMMIIVFTVVFSNIGKLINSSLSVEHTYEIIAETYHLEAYMVDRETGMRGFAVSGDEEFLEPYKSGGAGFDELMTKLQNAVQHGDRTQLEILIEIEALADEWDAEVASPIIALRRNLGNGEDMTELYAEFNKKLGVQYMDQIRSNISEFVAIENELLAHGIEFQETMASQSKNLLIWGASGAVFASLVIVTLITISMMRRLGGEPSEVAEVAERVSKGDLNISFNTNKTYRGLYGSMKSMVENLSSIVSEVSTSSTVIGSNSHQISTTSGQVSNGANDQATSVEEVSASMEEMVANIKQNALNAQETSKIATSAEHDLEIGKDALNETLSSMREIADKVKIIGDIARQTNVLALNAAVEAARAGEAGGGFAVVAEEVRNLAVRSQNSASDINDLAERSVEVADRTSALFEELIPNIQKTTQLVKSIDISSQEQNAGAEQINTAIQQLSVVTQQNAASAQELSASSHELTSQSSQLNDVIRFFKLTNESSNSFSPRKDLIVSTVPYKEEVSLEIEDVPDFSF